MYDIIIIGSGISGLYSAYKIKKYYPNKTFLILEKNNYIGGRMGNYNFYGSNVVTGAGIGRKKKDILLLNLLKKLNIKVNYFNVMKTYSKNIKPVNLKKIILFLKKIYIKNKKKYKSYNFKKFASHFLGTKLYNSFLKTSGYIDFEKEDVYETLYKYGIDDNTNGWIGVSVPWNDLLKKLIDFISKKNIKLNQYVNKIVNHNNYYNIQLNNNIKYKCKKIIIASTIDTVKKLLPKHSIYNQIKGQTFLRLYGKFTGCSIEIMKNLIPYQTNLNNHLQKIIPINKDKGIYMISYSDNKNAIFYKNKLKNNEKNRKYFCNELEKEFSLLPNTLHLKKIKAFYWNIGTHYYTPLKKIYKNRNDFIKKAQNPEKNIIVVGEMISRNQGWTEGALESVNNALNKNFILKK
jgi:hypothetical protein